MSRSMTISKLMLCAALSTALTACGDEATTNNAAASLEAANGMAEMADPNNPYAQSEMRMHERMMAATGANVSESWARKMIEHHRGAVEMSEVLLAQDPNSRFAEMARMTIQKQTAEIEELEQMLQPASSEERAPSANPDAPVASDASSETRIRTPPAAEAEPETPPPAADPHAGHDMGNMTNGM